MIYHVTIYFDGMTFERDFYSFERAERFAVYQCNLLAPATYTIEVK